jgi:adaptin ear-binding coat-associated protein 1/2
MEEIEYLLLQKPNCKAYEIPPAARSTGHLAEEWKNCIFSGKLKVMGRGKFCFIQLLNRENDLFVVCQVDGLNIERSVDRARDSSRYFVLTLVSPDGARAYIGMGFDERNDAFDFWACLLDFSARLKSETTPADPQTGPDLSHLQLKEGQTISLGSINKAPSTNAAPRTGLIKLKPPPK